MFQTSQDILNLTLAGAIALIGIFLAWALAEAAIALHEVNWLVRDARRKIENVERVLGAIKEKLEHSAGYLAVLATGVKSIMENFFGTGGKRENRNHS